MNDRFIGFCALMIGLALCLIGLGLLLRPAQYQAVAQIKIEPNIFDIRPFSGDGGTYGSYDPYFIETEFKIMVSNIVLSNVVQSLGLEEKWGKRYGNGKTMSADEAIRRLRRMIRIDADRNSKIIEISVTEENPDEAAQIANAVVEAYRKYRVDQYKLEMAEGIKMLEDDYQVEEVKLQAMQAQLEDLTKQFNATNSDPSLKLMNDGSYPEFKRHLDDTEELQRLLEAKIQSEKADETIPKCAPVVIIAPASSSQAPIGPNRLAGGFLLVCGVAMSSFGTCLLRGSRSKISGSPSNKT